MAAAEDALDGLTQAITTDHNANQTFECAAAGARATDCKIDYIPDEILIKIFQYLSPSQRIRIEEVSKRWKILSKYSWTNFWVLDDDSSFFSDLSTEEFSLHDLVSKPPMLKTLLQRCGMYLEKFILEKNYQLTFLKYGQELLDFLDHLELPVPSRNDYILSMVSQFCPNLVQLEFYHFPLGLSGLNNSAHNCSKLRSVSFAHCFNDGFVENELGCFIRYCPNLQTLDLSGNCQITGSCFRYLPSQLKRLNLFLCKSLENGGLQAISNCCPNLKQLQLGPCNKVTEGCLQNVIKILRKLQNLDVLSIPGLTTLLWQLSQLKKLDWKDGNISDEGLNIIRRTCPCLNMLGVAGSGISDNGLVYVCSLYHLTILDFNHCNQITDVGVKMLAKLIHLEILQLECCRITDVSMVDLANHCLKLRELNVRHCFISNATVRAFQKSTCKKTVPLNLYVDDTQVSNKECEIDHPMLNILFEDCTFLQLY